MEMRVEPLCRALSSPSTHPPLWKKGMGIRYRLESSSSSASLKCQAFSRRFACESRQPFGFPVVPDVYMIINVSLGLTSAAHSRISSSPTALPASMRSSIERTPGKRESPTQITSRKYGNREKPSRSLAANSGSSSPRASS